MAQPNWAETFNDFNTTAQAATSQSNTFDLAINKNFPAVIYQGTESNAIQAVTREVSGDFWTVQNADWNGSNWIPINLALPVYAQHLKSDGTFERLFCAAGTNPCVFTTLAKFDPNGNLFITPLAETTAVQNALSLTPNWNAGVNVMTALLVNVTDTASASGSKLVDLQVASASKWSVDKSGNANLVGNLVVGGNVTVTGTVVDAFGPRRRGTQNSVPSDGSVATTISYSTPFNTGTNQVICTIVNDPTGANPGNMSVQVRNKTASGFDVYVLGGDAGTTVTIDYLAYGT